MPDLGTADKPLRVAIVGAGPSGFYAAEALIKSDVAVQVDLIERLPAPFGLVRNGVAPDHPKLKQAIEVYRKIAQSPEFNYIGNVTVGRDVTPDELKNTHHAVIYTCGAETDRSLGIEGEDLPGSHTATEFVGWYNGHPDYRDREFDLSGKTAVVIGQGNVAIDVARVLAKSVDDLKHTDIAEHALDALSQSRIENIYVVGRRGPAQAKFTTKELREFADLANCRAFIDPAELELNEASTAEIADKKGVVNKKNMELFRRFSQTEDEGKPRTCRFTFLKSPVRLEGERRLERVIFEENALRGEPFAQSARGAGKTFSFDCDVLFRSIGYRGVAIPGVPFHEKWGVFPNHEGRVTAEHDGDVVPGIYTAGWIKRGPSGIIGTNRACAVETVKSLLADVAALDGNQGGDQGGAEDLYKILDERGVKHIGYSQWEKIDSAEVERGKDKGKPREKYTRVAEMLEIAGV